MQTLSLVLARTYAQRLWGLHRYPRLDVTRGLCIFPCSSVHTAFLDYSIDVVFLDSQWQVLKTVHALRPFRIAWCWRASMAVELRAGYCAAHRDFPNRIRSALWALQAAEGSTG